MLMLLPIPQISSKIIELKIGFRKKTLGFHLSTSQAIKPVTLLLTLAGAPRGSSLTAAPPKIFCTSRCRSVELLT